MNPLSFVSPCRDFRGEPRFRTGLQCEQAIVREGGERPVVKEHLAALPDTITIILLFERIGTFGI